MTEDLMRMASFRIDKELWSKFGAIAKRERLTVTDVLTDYIQRCTDNDRTEYAVNTGNDDVANVGTYDNDAVMTMVNTAIDNRVIPLIESATAWVVADEKALEELVKVNIEPFADILAELETYTRSQFETVREELKALNESAVVPTTDSFAPTQSINQLFAATQSINQSNAHRKSINRLIDPNRRTWGQFFEMVGMTAMTAGEAQKKENTPLRDKQITEGIAKAQEMGFGVWTAPRPGREFIKVEDKVNPPSPSLFTTNE